MDRVGYALPPIKSPGCTIGYMKAVRDGQYWCPLYINIKVASCYRPPKKDVIYNEVVRTLSEKGWNELGFSDSTKVPQEWLLKCLSTLDI